VAAGWAGGGVGCAALAAWNESGQLVITSFGSGSASCSLSSDGGGHAGIARSVGGSGGQISVSSGGAGASSEAGGHVDFVASEATFGGSVTTGWVGWSSGGFEAATGSADSSFSSEAGTVRAHSGVAFCGTAVSGLDGSSGGEVSVRAQSGSPFSISRLGIASDPDAVGLVPSAGVTGTVRAHGGVVSRVVTAAAGSSEVCSGGVEACSSGGSEPKTWSV
jgi:hypothetical protein